MKKITTFLALLLTCIIGATAADFVPRDGAKYLIKCKGDSKFAIWNINCKKTIDGTEYNSLSNWDKRDERSLFTFVSTGDGYFYIKPAADETHYVFAVNTIGSDGDKAHAEGNVAVKEVSDGNPDDACKWTISAQGTGWNIKPKGGNNGWNNRGGDGNGNATIGQWYGNNQSTNIWYIIEPVELNGYYTMRTKDDARGPYLYNDFSQDNVTRGGQLPSTVSNKYVWHVTSSAYGDKLTLVNGEGTLLGTSNSGTFETLEIAWNDGTYHFFSNQLDAGNANASYKASTWGSANKDLAQDLFRFDAVSSYTSLYTVNCNNADGYVTYNATSEKAKNGGFFNIATTPAAGDFTVKELEGYEATITIENKVIKVVYAHNYAYAKAEADATIAKMGVGYPTANAAARATLNKAIADAVAAEHNITTAATLLAAVDAYKKSKVDIQMPEDGKAYVITNIHKTGGKCYMRYQADGTSMIARGEGELPIEATYICHKVDGKYVFANNSGTYLTWRGNATGDCTNDNKGFTTSYDADYNTFTVAANPDVFGCLSFGAKRNGDTNKSYYIVTRTGSFQKAGFNNYYDDDNSSAFTFEEVTYPNTITFHDAQSINGVRHIATFSAPFATIIPAGVKAYYVSAKGTEATMTAIDAQVIPAKQGVILTSESDEAATMVPAAGETAAAITGNQLGHSAGVAKSLTAGEGYILGNGTEGTAFYPCKAGSLPINKAYLLGNGGENAIVMNFGNAVTGINTIAAPASAKAPIFDLSGRRVVKATKGLYIQNGKKVIVK